MKIYRIKVVATKTVTLTEEQWIEEGMKGIEFTDFAATQWAKGCLIEDLVNNPNRGTVKILFKGEK